jgi:hypothetical protein
MRKQTEEDRLLAKAISDRVKRRGGVNRRPAQKPGWSPPRCSRKGCNRLVDIRQKDFEEDRPYFCGVECFRIVRDAEHGRRGRSQGPSQPSISLEDGYGDV